MNSVASVTDPTSPPTLAPADNTSLWAGGRRAACGGAVALVSLLAFEAVAVAAAMPAIAEALNGVALYALAFGSTLATSLVGMVWAGAVCDRRGPRYSMAWGLVLFMAGLLVAGSACGMGVLVLGRALQGWGGGMLGVSLYVSMGRIVPSQWHPRLFALFAAAWVLPALVGPFVAASLVGVLGWRSVFWAVAAVVPVCAALLWPALSRLPRPAVSRAVPPSFASDLRMRWAVLGAIGALLLHAASQGGASGVWGGAALLLGLAIAGGAAWRLLPRGTLQAQPGLPSVIALRGVLASAFASAEVFIPLFLTREAGWSLAQAGLALSAGGVLWSGGSAVQARLVGPAHRRLGLQWGFACVAGGIAAVAAAMLGGLPTAWVLPAWALAGFGVGLSFPMLSVLTLSYSTPNDQGRHASALQLSDALCSSAVLALAGAVFNLWPAPSAHGYAAVMLLAVVLAVAGGVLGPRAFGRADATAATAP